VLLSLGNACCECVLGEHEGTTGDTMLSALSRGYGTWNGELDVYGEAPEKTV